MNKETVEYLEGYQMNEDKLEVEFADVEIVY